MQFWTADIEKQVGARVQIVLETPELLSAYQKFGANILRRSSVFHGLERFLRENEITGDCCFEIGTWNGLTAVVLSKFFAKVVSIDIVTDETAQARELKHRVLDHLGISRIKCIDVYSNTEKGCIADATNFDFAYLDGNHADDTRADWEMTRKCRRVLFHEAWPWQAPVWELIHQLPSDEMAYNGEGLAMWRGA